MKRSGRDKLLNTKLNVINVGAKTFYDSLREQGVRAIHVDWRPPAGGKPDLVKLLEKLS